MHQLLYISTSKEHLQKDDVLNILEVSREKNKRLDITGILLFSKRTERFTQVLEGEKGTIFDLYKNKICQDDRHYDVKLVYDGKVVARNFTGWSMAFKDLDEIDISQLKGYSKFAELGFTDETTPMVSSIAVDLIESFRRSLV